VESTSITSPVQPPIQSTQSTLPITYAKYPSSHTNIIDAYNKIIDINSGLSTRIANIILLIILIVLNILMYVLPGLVVVLIILYFTSSQSVYLNALKTLLFGSPIVAPAVSP
jgi:hypothetical protein